MLKLHRGTKVCPACGERAYNGAKKCQRVGCTYSWQAVKYRADTCRQDYFAPTSIPNPTFSTNFVSKGMTSMNSFTAEDYQFAKYVPPGVRYLANTQPFDATGRAVGEPRFAAIFPGFEGDRVFYANDRTKLMGLIWRIQHCNLKNLPNDYKKNGCGVER